MFRVSPVVQQGRLFDNSDMAGVTKTVAANHLRAWREKAGMTQAQLAEAIDTTTGVVSELESGRTQLSPKWLSRLAPVFGTTPGYLLDHHPDDVPQDIRELFQGVPEDRREEVREILRVFARKSASGR